MKHFTLEEIELLHMQVIDASGGSHGVRDHERLKSAVAAQTQEIFGKKLYATVFDVAAVITRNIIADHAFVDGNKRTGIMAAVIFLERNGIRTEITDQELEDFAVQVAVGKLDVAAVATWLENHSTANDGDV